MASSQSTTETSGLDPIANPPSVESTGQASQTPQTAKEYIDTQLRLEADAREALPYAFDTCTQPLGPLRQNLFSCLTCNPPPNSNTDHFAPAAVCYSCSIACHGEHTLVELFNRRNFVCDCGTTRLPATSPCNLRIDPATGMKGPVHSQEAAEGNKYNQNCQNLFCGCGDEYDAHKERGTMFQCLGLAEERDGGCGEDWWHPDCVVWGGEVGKRKRREGVERLEKEPEATDGDIEDSAPPPAGFPDEDDFATFICYKCVEAAPWIKQYAGTKGFLKAVYRQDLKQGGESNDGIANGHMRDELTVPESAAGETAYDKQSPTPVNDATAVQNDTNNSRKRSAEIADLDSAEANGAVKKTKAEEDRSIEADQATVEAYHSSLPPTVDAIPFSLFCKEDFRDHFCRCKECYLRLKNYPQLLEEEEAYEPPLSESGDGRDGTGSVGSKSLLERGEAALSNVDRVRAIGERFSLFSPSAYSPFYARETYKKLLTFMCRQRA